MSGHLPHRLDAITEQLEYEHLSCPACGFVQQYKHCRRCLDKALIRRSIPLIDYRHQEMSLNYPANREWVYREFKEAHAKAVQEWYYEDRYDPDGPQITILEPEYQEGNRAAQDPAGSPIEDNRIHFGFDNMWNIREPMFIIQDDGEAKIWWQRKNVHFTETRAPENTRFLRDAISPRLFLKRLAANFGLPPDIWPLQDPFDHDTLWGAMLTRDNGDQLCFREYLSRIQIAYNGSCMGMYDAVGIIQLIVGPPGDELYTEKYDPENDELTIADRLAAAIKEAGPGPVISLAKKSSMITLRKTSVINLMKGATLDADVVTAAAPQNKDTFDDAGEGPSYAQPA